MLSSSSLLRMRDDKLPPVDCSATRKPRKCSSNCGLSSCNTILTMRKLFLMTQIKGAIYNNGEILWTISSIIFVLMEFEFFCQGNLCDCQLHPTNMPLITVPGLAINSISLRKLPFSGLFYCFCGPLKTMFLSAELLTPTQLELHITSFSRPQ